MMTSRACKIMTDVRVQVGNGRGGAGERSPTPPQSPTWSPRPGPEMFNGAKTSPGPIPRGSPIPDPRSPMGPREDGRLAHPIFIAKPNASHMYARISIHTYDRRHK